VDKATWDGWSHIMFSNEGGTSYASQLPFNNPNSQGNLLTNLSNMVTPLTNPTSHGKYQIRNSI
jgi:K+-transporting ATPase A subunit